MNMIVSKKEKRNRGGFTLLELLVVVAILAAVAGTASIALKDTDARASAAAHVTMMDELNKGIRTYRVLQRNELPSRFDSLLNTTAGTGADGDDPGCLGFDIGDGCEIGTLTADVEAIMVDGGISELMYVDTTALPEGANAAAGLDCTAANIKALIASRANAVVAGNIFLPEAANGCGVAVALDGSDGSGARALFWTGGTTRLTGQPDPADLDSDGNWAGTTSLYNADGNYAYLLTGIGPSCTLFDANTLGGMTTVPVYRHVKPDEYNRFIAVWNVGTYLSGAIVAGDQCELVAIVDGALDTKEEELGEWDGTRNTI
ncbi:MAG: prepilin-type N-terminal cleavage/methylation domain-containing protein [Verrucomicrobiota bacterium JB024]|nr:prepilin-type N-terminal cleavage/methylation domain-containing protein [Verrucomicrobiota bacterium JB024]